MDEKISARRARTRLRTMGAKIVPEMEGWGVCYTHPIIEGRMGVIGYYDHNCNSVYLPELEAHLKSLKYVQED